MKEQKDPKMDWGFHAVIPRIVRTEYKQVAPLQKWAYVCLKDLCGETGTCYRTIRVLSEEIGLSVGMTSETIRVLHDAGLIHAEKKKRHTGGKEVWHITIVDIWAKNGATHPTKRSPHEQECSPHERTTGQSDVHSANVHRMNKNNEFCSPHEQECSHSETEEESISRIITEAGSEDTDAHASPAREEKLVRLSGHDYKTPHLAENCVQWRSMNQGKSCQDYQAAIDAAHETITELSPVLNEKIEQVEEQREAIRVENNSHSQFSTSTVDKPSSESAKTQGKRTRKSSSQKKKEPEPPAFTPEGQKVYDAWASLFKSPPRVGEKTVDCAGALYPRLVPWCKELKLSCAALLDEIQKHLYKTDTSGFYRRGVTLCDIDRDFEKWQSAKTQEMIQQAQKAAPPKELSTVERLRQQEQRYVKGGTR